MVVDKALLLKGMLGFGAASSVVYVGLSKQDKISEFIFGSEETAKPEAVIESASKLLDEVGLSCDLEKATAEVGVVCSKKEGEGVKIKVKQESTPFDVSTLPSGDNTGKIKVYRDDGYENKFKFVIEDGDIAGADSASGKKLEEFETYEIKEEIDSSKKGTKAYYLNRRTKATEKIKVLLGLGACDFPGDAATTCSITAENIDSIRFEGKDGKATGTGSLQISKASTTETQDFPHGFKFTLTPSSGNISIPKGTGKGALTLNNGAATVFNIKKSGTSLTLEETLTQEVLTKKVGLQCGAATAEGVECSKASDGNIKVKQGDSTTFEVSNIDSGKKIKLYKAGGTDGYNKGLKFVIEDGDISASAGSNKLEQFETYEIKEHSGTHYLTRKTKVGDKIAKDLGLPDSCKLPDENSVTCQSVSAETIKFEGKSGAVTGTGNLKIDVVTSNDADFPHGFKFTLTPTSGDITINRGSSESWALKNGKATEFKLKKKDKTFTLEKAWTLETLTGKVGISCAGNGGTDCSLKTSGKLALNKGSSNKSEHELTSSPSGSSGKIKLYKGNEQANGYENEFKFVIEGGDIAVNSTTSTPKLEQFETYEIKKVDDKWYLSLKDGAWEGVRKELGLPTDCNLTTNSNGCSDVVLDTAKLKTIKFDGKDSSNSESLTVPTDANMKLTVTKETDSSFYTDGYKFVFKTEKDVTINGTNGKNIVFKKGNDLEFKLKKTSNSNALTLEKAWTVTELAKKVGLTCPAVSGGSAKECSLGTGININNGDSSKKFTGLSKKDENGEGKKVKYDEDQGGYNQGFKFYVDGDSDIELKNGSGASENMKILKKNGSNGDGEVSYEIKKEDSNWYLLKKATANAS